MNITKTLAAGAAVLSAFGAFADFDISIDRGAKPIRDGGSISVDGQAEVRISDGTVTVTSTGEVSFVRVSFPWALPREALVLNDAWERSYGDLEWKDLAETRVSPWYYLASVSNRTWGVGVETGPGAMCCWEVTTNGAVLVLDLRAGGRPVRLCGRSLRACRIVRAESRDGESAWRFGPLPLGLRLMGANRSRLARGCRLRRMATSESGRRTQSRR